MESRLTAMEDLQKSMGQLLVIHDGRIRELGVMFCVVTIPKGTTYFTRAEEVDVQWKTEMKDYHARRKETGQTEAIGSKHLKIAAAMLEAMNMDQHTRAEVKQALGKRWDWTWTSNS